MSVALNGTTQALTRTASVFNQNGDYTWSAWYRFATVQSGAFFHSVGANSSAPVPDQDYCQVQSTTTRIGANDVAGGTIDFNDGSNTFLVDTWYYVTLQRTGSTLRCYVRPNGGTTALSVSITAAVAGRAAAALMVMGRRGTNDRYHACQIAYARLHTSVLTTGQIDTEATSPTAVVTSNLWGSWKLTDASTLTDDSGNSRDLTGVNSPTTGADTPSDVAVGPTIDTQPTAGTVTINNSATPSKTFTVSATTDGPALAYQWQKEDSVGAGTYSNVSNGGIYAGATTASFTVTPTTKTGLTGIKFRCNVTGTGTTTTNAVVLTVYTGFQFTSSTSATTDGSGQATVTWTDDRPGSALGNGCFVKHIATSGSAVSRSSARPT